MFLRPAVIAVLTLGTGLGAWYQSPTLPPQQGQQLVAPAELPVTPPATQSVPAAPVLRLENGLCDPNSVGATADFTPASACGFCPPEWPKCYRDRDCDSVCGGKGTGVCEWINSCHKCCTCAGTT